MDDNNDKEKPQKWLRLIADNAPGDIKKLRALDFARQVHDRRLREVAGNLLRVIRGAGKPYELPHQCAAYVEAYNNYLEAGGHSISDEISTTLRFEKEPAYDRQWDFAFERIVDGALRYSAGRILAQRLQASAGKNDLMDGFYDLERVREQTRKEFESPAQPKRSAPRRVSVPPTRTSPQPLEAPLLRNLAPDLPPQQVKTSTYRVGAASEAAERRALAREKSKAGRKKNTEKPPSTEPA